MTTEHTLIPQSPEADHDRNEVTDSIEMVEAMRRQVAYSPSNDLFFLANGIYFPYTPEGFMCLLVNYRLIDRYDLVVPITHGSGPAALPADDVGQLRMNTRLGLRIRPAVGIGITRSDRDVRPGLQGRSAPGAGTL